MAKVFTTNGTGASQTLDEASSNRIKVYDDFDSIDKTALADGEIVSTKEDGAGGNVYDYINEMLTKENLLSDFETITLPTSAANAMTMEYDGELVIQVNGINGQQTNASFYVNNILIGATSMSGTYVLSTLRNFSFTRGDVIYATISGGSFTTKVRYYKQRYYGGRN